MKQKIGAILVAFSAALLLLSWLWSSKAAFAVQTTVTVCASGCDYTTISDAVYDAPEGSIIDVQAGTFTETVLITQSLTIQGQGIGATIVDGQELGAVFEIEPGSTVTIKEMTIQNGLSVDGGGGIYNDGTLTITNLLIQNNVADNSDGGGVLNLSQIIMQNVTLANNEANFGAGFSNDLNGIASASNITVTQNKAVHYMGILGEGGGIENNGEFSLENSIIRQNSADGSGGGIVNGGALTVTLSIIESNVAVEDGAGIDNAYNLGVAAKAIVISSTIQDNIAGAGGGVNNAGEFWLLESLVYSNTAGLGAGGGLHNLNDAKQAGELHVINSTVSGNMAGQGGGLYNEGIRTTAVLRSSTVFGNLSLVENSGNLYSITGTVTLSNSIVASPLGINNNNCEGSVVSDGYNLDTDDTCGLGTGERRGITNPFIDSLKDNGGPTLTHALLAGSPAIDASPVCEPADQRGVPRPDGIACDIGAYETHGYPIFLPTILKQN